MTHLYQFSPDDNRVLTLPAFGYTNTLQVCILSITWPVRAPELTNCPLGWEKGQNRQRNRASWSYNSETISNFYYANIRHKCSLIPYLSFMGQLEFQYHPHHHPPPPLTTTTATTCIVIPHLLRQYCIHMFYIVCYLQAGSATAYSHLVKCVLWVMIPTQQW